MTTEQAARRFYVSLAIAMSIFLGGSLGVAWLDKHADLPVMATVALAVVPMVALLSMFWLHWRFVREIDEFLRQIQIKALLSASAAAMAIASGWGYLENYVDAPALPIFYLNPIFWLAYGIAVGIFTRRETGSLS